VLAMFSPRNGVRWAHIVSLISAVLLAALFFKWQSYWPAFLFVLFAIQNYQALHTYYEYARNSQDIDDWWRH
jgi:stage IV sporulation protein FB